MVYQEAKIVVKTKTKTFGPLERNKKGQ